MKFKLKYVVLLLVLSLFGCNSTAPVEMKQQVQQEVLLERCSEDTPLPTQKTVDKDGNVGYDGKEVFRVLREWDAIYFDCASRLDALITYLQKTQDPNFKVTIKDK